MEQFFAVFLARFAVLATVPEQLVLNVIAIGVAFVPRLWPGLVILTVVWIPIKSTGLKRLAEWHDTLGLPPPNFVAEYLWSLGISLFFFGLVRSIRRLVCHRPAQKN